MYAEDRKVYHPAPAEWIHPVYSSQIEDVAHDNCVLRELCNEDYTGELKGFGSELIIRTMPEIEVHDWIPDTEFIPQRPTSPAIRLKVGRAWEASFVIDDWDEMNSDIKGWVSKWATKLGPAVAEKQEAEYFLELPAFAGPKNQGQAAGRYKSFHLGDISNPLKIRSDNKGYAAADNSIDATQLLLDAETVHSEVEGAGEAQKWIVVPKAYLNMVRKNEIWEKAAYSGDSQSILRKDVLAAGQLGVGGFKVYATNHLKPVRYTEAGRPVFALPFGDKRGVTYVPLFDRVDIKDEPKKVGVKYQVHTGGYDWKCIHPEFMGVCYVEL